MLSIPLVFGLEGIQTTGSTVIDFFGTLSVYLYDLLGGTGSASFDVSGDDSGNLFPTE